MKVLLLALCAAGAAAVSLVNEVEWAGYKAKYNKSYADAAEELHRQKAYLNNKEFVERHMREYAEGKHSFTVELNHFADLTLEEFNSGLYKGLLPSASVPQSPEYLHKFTGKVWGAQLDWRQYGAVTPVKNQGACGSCWSFSTTGAIEGAWALAQRGLNPLSEQQLVDCSHLFLNMGCNGGNQDFAFNYLLATGGIESETTYPYTAQDGKCHSNKQNFVAKIRGHHGVLVASESHLLDALASHGPIAVSIDASKQSFQLYKGGVYNEPSCSSLMLDHAVLAVGYGTNEYGQDYWIVKNSWGTTFGEQGYINMVRNNGNQCGIATRASYPTV